MTDLSSKNRMAEFSIGAASSLIAALLMLAVSAIWKYPLAMVGAAFAINIGLFLVYRKVYSSALFRLSMVQTSIGLVKIDPTLREGEDPLRCMAKATTSLKFMGIGGQKWSAHESELKDMLSCLARVKGSACFLLLDPASKIVREASELSGHAPGWLAERITTSLRQFKVLRDKGFRNLEVRLYDHYPYYRLVLLNNNLAIVGQYRGVDTTTGWESPLAHFVPGGPFSFYQGYHVHFDGEWAQAKELDWNSLI